LYHSELPRALQNRDLKIRKPISVGQKSGFGSSHQSSVSIGQKDSSQATQEKKTPVPFIVSTSSLMQNKSFNSYSRNNSRSREALHRSGQGTLRKTVVKKSECSRSKERRPLIHPRNVIRNGQLVVNSGN
jgi:hypothetical protein